MTLTAIEDVFYYVSDQARAVAFYTDILGMRVVYQDEVWTGLVLRDDPATDPVKIGLLAIGTTVPQHVVQLGDRQIHPGATLSFRTDDIDTDIARLRELGVPILREIERGSWGAGALFADPDGNWLMLYQPPPQVKA